MPDYRIYWLDHDNHISSADDLTIDTDEAALAAAEARLGTAPAMEVWRGAQRIGHVSTRDRESEFSDRRQPIEDDALPLTTAGQAAGAASVSNGRDTVRHNVGTGR